MQDDAAWMRQAIAEAEKALEQGEVAVGAVVVRRGTIMGRGHNRTEKTGCPFEHAEIPIVGNLAFLRKGRVKPLEVPDVLEVAREVDRELTEQRRRILSALPPEVCLQVLAADGLLLSASCSFHLSAAEHQEVVAGAASDVGCWAQILERGHQAADHPVHPWLPESEYLKALLVRVARD